MDNSESPFTARQYDTRQSIPSQNCRYLLEKLADDRNREANELHALLRSLPPEMTPAAELALYRLVLKAQR